MSRLASRSSAWAEASAAVCRRVSAAFRPACRRLSRFSALVMAGALLLGLVGHHLGVEPPEGLGGLGRRGRAGRGDLALCGQVVQRRGPAAGEAAGDELVESQVADPDVMVAAVA